MKLRTLTQGNQTQDCIQTQKGDTKS